MAHSDRREGNRPEEEGTQGDGPQGGHSARAEERWSSLPARVSAAQAFLRSCIEECSTSPWGGGQAWLLEAEAPPIDHERLQRYASCEIEFARRLVMGKDGLPTRSSVRIANRAFEAVSSEDKERVEHLIARFRGWATAYADLVADDLWGPLLTLAWRASEDLPD